jgi:hypothetical protein
LANALRPVKIPVLITSKILIITMEFFGRFEYDCDYAFSLIHQTLGNTVTLRISTQKLQLTVPTHTPKNTVQSHLSFPVKTKRRHQKYCNKICHKCACFFCLDLPSLFAFWRLFFLTFYGRKLRCAIPAN